MHFLAPKQIEKTQKPIYYRKVPKRYFRFRQKRIQNFKVEKNDATEKVKNFPNLSYFGHFTSWGDPIFKNNTIFFNLKMIQTQWKCQFLNLRTSKIQVFKGPPLHILLIPNWSHFSKTEITSFFILMVFDAPWAIE